MGANVSPSFWMQRWYFFGGQRFEATTRLDRLGALARKKPIMNEQSLPAEYLVICCGQWDPTASRDEIKTAIDQTSQPSLTKLDRNVGENPHLSGNSPFKRRDPAGDQLPPS
jgi:hypothetical protein